MTPRIAPLTVPLPSSLHNCLWCTRCKAGAGASKGNYPALKSLTQGPRDRGMESYRTKLRGMGNVVCPLGFGQEPEI